MFQRKRPHRLAGREKVLQSELDTFLAQAENGGPASGFVKLGPQGCINLSAMTRDILAADSVGFHLITALPPQEATAFVTPAGLAARPAGGV